VTDAQQITKRTRLASVLSSDILVEHWRTSDLKKIRLQSSQNFKRLGLPQRHLMDHHLTH